MILFFYELQKAGIPVSVKHILEFYRALRRGLARDLDQLFVLARLVFVKRLEHYDPFEQVFASFFLGQEGVEGAIDWEEALAGKPFEEWLQAQIDEGNLTPEAIREFEMDELLAKFWQTLLEQDGRHDGGSRWIGTRGRSPYGHSGKVGGGIRVHGEGLHGTARKVIGNRRFLNYAEKSPLSGENLHQVLTSLKSLRPTGAETELDVDETIYRTARNGGEIELVFTRQLQNKLRLIVCLDNGGYSMTRFLNPVRTVFNKIRGSFRDVSFYYFHNCIYGTVYHDPQRRNPRKWEQLLGEGRSTRLIIIGDADMAPAELMASYGSLDFHTNDRKPGIEWLKELKAAFPASVWLNPIRKGVWGLESSTIERIRGIFHMEDLTLSGIKNAVEYLNLNGQAWDAVS